MSEDCPGYPVGSVGYYKWMQRYVEPEHLREGYIEPKRVKRNIPLKRAIRIKTRKLNYVELSGL